MKISDFLAPELIVCNLSNKDKIAALKELTECIASNTDEANAEQMYMALMDRERLQSTGIGDGVAIPHGKLPAISRLYACLGLSPEGVDFDSIDGKPAHIIFALLAPETASSMHLKALARVSRVFRNDEVRKVLCTCGDPKKAFDRLVEEDEQL